MNKKLWKMYKNSDEGKKCITLFEPEKEDMVIAGFEILLYADKWGDDKTVDDDFGSFEYNMFINTCNLYHRDIFPEEWTMESFTQMMEELDLLEPQMDEEGNPIYSDDKKVQFADKCLLKKDEYRGKASMLIDVRLVLQWESRSAG